MNVESDISATTHVPVITNKTIKVPNLTLSVGPFVILRDTDFILNRGARYALVGKNGSGKSTLLKWLTQQGKTFGIPDYYRILYVEQEVQASDKTALQEVMDSDEERTRLLDCISTLESANDCDIDELNDCYEKLDALSGDSALPRAKQILNGLQFTESMQNTAISDFSGGWRMRIALAKALFLQPDILLLDEPTNHLDLNATIWLKNFLSTWKRILLVVSHDREFMSISTHTIHLNELKLNYYKYTFEKFEEIFNQQLLQHINNYDKQQKQIKKWKKNGKNVKQQLKNLKQDLITKPKGKPPVIDFGVSEHDDYIFKANNVNFSYGDNIIFNNLSMQINHTQKIVLVGPNGSGKSTFLKLLTGQLIATKGTIQQHPTVRIGTYSQHFVDQLPLEQNPTQYLTTKYPDWSEQECREQLGRMGLLGKHHKQVMSTLSGGQKSRVMLAEITIQMPDILLLDEPTNHLDLETVDALSNAIADFDGAAIVITHSLHLIDRLGESALLYHCDNNDITPYDGNIWDYEEDILSHL